MPGLVVFIGTVLEPAPSMPAIEKSHGSPKDKQGTTKIGSQVVTPDGQESMNSLLASRIPSPLCLLPCQSLPLYRELTPRIHRVFFLVFFLAGRPPAANLARESSSCCDALGPDISTSLFLFVVLFVDCSTLLHLLDSGLYCPEHVTHSRSCLDDLMQCGGLIPSRCRPAATSRFTTRARSPFPRNH
ncbi:hypothetical protein LY78DRAFT_33356 [Colletotrichum sublineola]|nr:hypothetical protein LY78DRAFT_33356 [Colletotrichum sublineola]